MEGRVSNVRRTSGLTPRAQLSVRGNLVRARVRASVSVGDRVRVSVGSGAVGCTQ